MQVYFSHSYRDVAINSYFLDHFVDAEIPLQADQKSDVWCVAKLERYLGETTGFVSVIPKRPTEKDPSAYSLYIGHELTLARRSRVPRLLFIDQDVLKHHRLEFPRDAVGFDPDSIDDGSEQHGDAIRAFRKTLETVSRPRSLVEPKTSTVVAAPGKSLQRASDDVAEILRRENFNVTLLSGRRPGRGLDDIRLLEALWSAELCVFLLDRRLSEAHVALAMAHAHCIPSVRLLHDAQAEGIGPSLSGVIQWRALEDMLVEFSSQITSYKAGLVHPVQMAVSSTSEDAVRSVGTMKRRKLRNEDIWEIANGPALIDHVFPGHGFVLDEIDRARAQSEVGLGSIHDRTGTMELCATLYDGIRRHRYGYEIEQATGIAGTQAIRSPSQIRSHETATCIDLACLFAALLEAAGQNPLIVVLQGPDFTHALAGYRLHGEAPWEDYSIGTLRGAVARRDAVLFETTGAVVADSPVGAERPEERQQKLLGFADARKAAERMLTDDRIRLKHFVDVRVARTGNH